MRFLTAAVALFASVVLAQQNNAINIPAGQSTLQITAGQPETITWSNPSSGAVTIKLQQSNGQITPDSGIVLGTTQASAGTFTFTIDPSKVNSFQYTIEIIDDTNPNNYNFSPNFGIIGATGTSTATASTASASGSSASASTSGTKTGSTSSSSETTAAASSSNSSSSSTTSKSSSTHTSSSATSTTSAPSANGAGAMKVQGGLLAIVAGIMAVL